MLLSVIVPCYNEEHTIQTIIEQVQAVALHKEIIIVDDCSADNTPAIVARITASDPTVRALRHPAQRGKDEAIRTGLAAATVDIVIIQDADLEYDPTDYYDLSLQLQSNDFRIEPEITANPLTLGYRTPAVA